jgi:hypothetical protein
VVLDGGGVEAPDRRRVDHGATAPGGPTTAAAHGGAAGPAVIS